MIIVYHYELRFLTTSSLPLGKFANLLIWIENLVHYEPIKWKRTNGKNCDSHNVRGMFHGAQDMIDKVDNGYYATLLIRTPIFQCNLVWCSIYQRHGIKENEQHVLNMLPHSRLNDQQHLGGGVETIWSFHEHKNFHFANNKLFIRAPKLMRKVVLPRFGFANHLLLNARSTS